MISHNEVAYMSASEIASKIKDLEFPPVEVIEAFITRIEERNKSLNALVLLWI
jgi:amidase